MKKKLLVCLIFASIILTLVGCTSEEKEQIKEVQGNNMEVTEIKNEVKEQYPYEYEITTNIKNITNALHCTFIISDNTKLIVTIEGDRAVLSSNKNKVIEYLKKDTKYTSIQLMMYDVGGVVMNSFINEKIK